MIRSSTGTQKKLQWYAAFGTISIDQLVLRSAPKGARVHPFRDFAKISNRGVSRILSRRIVDFSAERSFAQSALALREHYHIEVPVSCTDKVTAQVCREAKARNSTKPGTVVDAEVLVSETDGSMLPVISTEPPEGAAEKDRRKHRKCHWKGSSPSRSKKQKKR